MAPAPGFIWDDDDYVYENPLLSAPDGLRRIWFNPAESPQYYPLVFTTFWLEYRLWGGPDETGRLEPHGYHLTNVLLHAINAILLWIALRRLGLAGAFAVALVFALHPFFVESVAWVTERKNVLSAFFYLLSMLSLLRWEGDESARRRWLWWALALLLFALGLFSKTVIASLPVVMVLLRWWRRQPITVGYVAAMLPFLILGAAMGSVTAAHEAEIVLGGLTPEHWQFSPADRVLIAGRALWFYPAKLLWPFPLVFNYERWTIDPGQWWQWIYPITALLFGTGLLLLSRRIGRGLPAAAMIYAVTIFPALGFVNVAPMRYSFVADHFAYLASVPILCAVVGLLLQALQGVAGIEGERSRIGVRLAAGLTGAIALVLGALTFRQTAIYRDIETLYRDTIEHYPQSHLARINLGVLLRQRGEIDEATMHFEQVLHDWPDWSWPRSKAFANLGNIAQDQGRLDEAISLFEQARELLPEHPEPTYNLANALMLRGEAAAAAARYEELLSRFPQHVKGRINYGLALERLGRASEARDQYSDAIAIDEAQPLAWLGLGRVLRQERRPGDALVALRRADSLAPGQLQTNRLLLEALVLNGDTAAGIEQARRVIAMAPDDAGLRFETALFLRSNRVHAPMEEILREGLARQPDNPSLTILLAEQLAASPLPQQRDGAEAVRLAERLVAARSDDVASLATLAAAYAEAGRFPEAERMAVNSLELARSRNLQQMIPVLQARLEMYRSGQPLRLP